jgi:hypothetical protein
MLTIHIMMLTIHILIFGDRWHSYDAIGTLADAAQSLLTPHAEVLLAPMFAKWSALAPADPETSPLLECLASVVQAMGGGYHPWVVGFT